MTRRPVAAATLLLVLVAGCVRIPADDTGTAPAAAGTARASGELRVGITEPGELDPPVVRTESARLIAQARCQTLVTLDAATGLPRPSLARRVVKGGDGKTITIVLRKGSRFPDGTAVTSLDVLRTLQRVALPATASPAADLLSPVAGYDTFRSEAERTGRTPKTFTGVRLVSPEAVELTLREPRPDLVAALAEPAFAIGDEAHGCVGPYRLARPYAVGDAEVVLERTTGVAGDGARTNGGHGYVDRIVFRTYPDAAAVVSAYRRGEVDLAQVVDGQPSPEDLTADVVTGPANHVEYLGAGLRIATAAPAEQVAAFRRGLSLALDRTAIAADVFGRERIPATGLVPPAVGAAYDEDTCASSVRPTPDLAAARAAIDAAPQVPRTLRLAFNDENRHAALAAAVRRQLAVVGVEVELQPLTWDDYLEGVERGTDGLFRESWEAPYLSAEGYLGPLLLADGIGSTNLARYDAPDVDAALRYDARPVADDLDRALAYRRVEAAACRDLPLVPVVFSQSRWLVRSKVLAARNDGRRLGASGEPLLDDLTIAAGRP